MDGLRWCQNQQSIAPFSLKNGDYTVNRKRADRVEAGATLMPGVDTNDRRAEGCLGLKNVPEGLHDATQLGGSSAIPKLSIFTSVSNSRRTLRQL